MTSSAEQSDLQRIEHVALSQPLLRGLLRDIPLAYTHWSKKERQEWLGLAAAIFDVLYTEPEAAGSVQPDKQSR